MALDENFDVIFDGILKDMVALGHDYENMLSLFISNSTLFEKEDLRKEMLGVVHQMLAENPDDSLAALKKILAHSENCLVDSFIANIFSPILKINNSLKDGINQITKPFMIHYFNSPDLKADLNLLLNYINDYAVTAEILSAMVKIAKTNEDPDQALTSLLMSSPLFLNTRLTPAEKSTIETKMLDDIRSISTSESSEYIEKLSEIIQTAEKQALQYYSVHQVSGNEVVNDAIGNGCEGVGGRSEYVSEHFIKQHRLSFYMYTGPEHDSVRKAVYNFFNEKQGDRSGHNQDKIDYLKDAYGELERFLEVRFIVPTFMQGKPLDEPTRIYLAGLDGKDVRAIFGANLTQRFLSNSPGYTSLTFEEELKLYRDIVDTQHKYKHDHRKEEQQIFDLINAAITNHAVNTGEENLLLGEFSIKDASASIQDNSKLAGENHWQGTPDELTRPIHPRESNWFRKQLNSIGTFAKNLGDKADKASDGKVSLGGSTDGQGLDIGLRNNQTNQAHGLHIGFGKTPGKNLFEDEKPKIESTGFSEPSEKEVDIDIEQLAEVEAFNWKMIMERYPEVKQTPLMQEMDQGWHDLIERTYHKRDETDYVQDFARIYDQMYKPTPPPPVAPPALIERVTQLPVNNQEITQSGMSAEPEALPKYPLARKILLAPLYYAACAISGDAEASPLRLAMALAQLAKSHRAAGAAGAGFMGWMASFKRHDEEQDENAPPNPWVKLLDSFYPGRNPQEGEEIDSSSTFPAEERQGWKLETPIDHSITKAINTAGKHIIPILPMMYLSKNGREESNVGEGANGSDANNHINGLRIRRQLAAEQASSVFTKNGGLQQDIIDRSLLVIESKSFRNKDLINELEAIGGNISDWGKYKTPLIIGPAGRFEMHFYQNSVTKEVYYGRDYKAVLEHQGKWNSELKPVFEYEPPRFSN